MWFGILYQDRYPSPIEKEEEQCSLPRTGARPPFSCGCNLPITEPFSFFRNRFIHINE
jgi:hypothetical protein